MRALSIFYIILFFGLFVGKAQTTETLTTSGNWVVPCGVYNVTVEAWGGGGGGAGDNTNNAFGGAGGGGGGYASSVVAVTPGNSISYSIGLGGLGGSGSSPGSSGSNTLWDSGVIMAEGGQGGNAEGGTGGLGATGSIGDITYYGGDGFMTTSLIGGGGGSSAGNSANGNSAISQIGGIAPLGGGDGGDGGASSTFGVDGFIYGGGGGGAGNRTMGAALNGGNGADGKIVLTYTPSLNPTLKIGPTGDYISLTDAISELTCVGISQPFVLELEAAYTSASETFPITIGAISGASATNTITIRPESGATGLSISNTLAVPNLNLNNASYIIVDGRPDGLGLVSQLTIENSNSSGQAIKFINDASNNLFQWTIIKGENTSGTSGVIEFSTTTITTGNDNNTITDCFITKTTNNPVNAIISAGSIGAENSQNKILYNEFVDIWDVTTVTGSSIKLNSYSTNWELTGNHFYQSTSVANCNNVYAFIQVLSGGNHLINSNFIGGTASYCGGSPYVVSSGTSSLQGIRMNTSTGTNTITNNTFSNIQYTSTATTALYPLIGMSIEGSSNYEIGTYGNGNTIGSTSGTGSLILTNNAASGSYGILGINYNSSGTVSIKDNNLGALTLNGTKSAATTNLLTLGPSSGIATVDNNYFGNSTNNNIYIASNSQLLGINNSSSNNATYTNNLFQGWDVDATSTTCVGIYKNQNSLNLSNNNFQNLDIQYNFVGVDLETSATLLADNNLFENIVLSGTGTGLFSVFYLNSSGASTISNNTIGGYAANNIQINSDDQFYIINNLNSGKLTATDNIIQNFSLTNSGISNEFKGISNTGTGVLEATNNLITDIVSQSTGPALVGIHLNPSSTTSNNLINNNIIQNLYSDNATTNGAACYGIELNNANGSVASNFISGLESKSISSVSIEGISLGSNAWNIKNNVIILDNGANTNDCSIRGLSNVSTGTYNIYHNTVLLSGVQSGSSYSTCIDYTVATSLTIYNNIFQNLRSGGAGGHYAVYATSGWDQTNNNNYLEVSENLSNLCYNGGPEDFATWQSSTGADASLSGTETFDSYGYPSPGFIGASSGTDLYSSGTVTTDFDGITRSTTPWMGAYEGLVKDKDCQLNVGSLTEPVSISSLIDADGEEIMVLDFDFQDLGTSDGLDIIIDSIYFSESIDDVITDWSTIIAGAKLFGPDYPTGINGTIYSNEIAFGSSGMITITNATTESYELRIYLNTDLSEAKDNDVIGIELDYLDIVTQPTGSQFGSGFVETGYGNVAIDIVATELMIEECITTITAYVDQPFVITALAVDVNGNIDLNESSSVDLALISGIGTLSSVSGLSQTFFEGAYGWDDVEYNTTELITIQAQHSILINASCAVDVKSATVLTVGDSREYNTIQGAYDIVPNSPSSAYIIEVYSDYNSANETFPIVFNNKSNTNEIIVRPASGQTGIECSGSLGSNGIWVLDNAQNIIIDGRPGGVGESKEFLVKNTKTTAPFGCTFLLKNDVNNVNLKYLTCEGETGTGSSLNGIITIGGTTFTNGNDNISITDCTIQDITTGGTSVMPWSAIYSEGAAGKENDYLTINNCDIYNGGLPSIDLFSNNSFGTITNNHIYISANTSIGSVAAQLINIGGGSDYTISNNYLGGSERFCGGSQLNVFSGTAAVELLKINASGTNYITNNTIANVNYTTTYNLTNYAFTALSISGSGNFEIGGPSNSNQIGSTTVSNSVTLNQNGTSGMGFSALYNNTTGTITFSSNYLGGIQISGTNTSASSSIIDNYNGLTFIDNNLIENITNNIDAYLYLIDNSSASAITITDNSINNINQNATNNSLYIVELLAGGATISNNLINNINSVSNSPNRLVYHVASGSALTFENNNVKNINFSSTGASASGHLVYINSTISSNINNNTFGGTSTNSIVHSGNNNFIGLENISSGTLNVQNNSFQNITHQTTGSGTFSVISNTGGQMVASNNLFDNIETSSNAEHQIIKHASASALVTITDNSIRNVQAPSTGASNALKVILVDNDVNATISNNTIGATGLVNITCAGGGSTAGIHRAGVGESIINNNTIQEFQTSNSVSTVQLWGIRNDETGTMTATNNSIQHLYCNVIGDASAINLVGIGHAPTSGAVVSITDNNISGLYLTNSNVGNSALMAGINHSYTTSGTLIQNNFVSDLEAAADNSFIYGLYGYASTTGFEANVYNNVVLLPHSGMSNGPTIEGINISYGATSNSKVYHNTVKVSGNAPVGTKTTSAFTAAQSGSIDIKNNIFQNLRTSAGICRAVRVSNTTGKTIDFNYIEVHATQVTNITNWGGTDYDFTNWKSASGAINDVSGTENIDESGYADGTFVAGAGTDLTATVPNDKEGNPRTSTPWLGAYETSTPLCGTFTIGGATPDYATISAAVSDINANGISCPVVFNIRDGIYNEQLSVLSINGSSGTNIVTFQSESLDSSLVSVTFAANVTDNYTWDLNGASNIILNKLGFLSTDATYGSVIQIRGSGSNISITNCDIKGVSVVSNTTNHSLIYSSTSQESNVNIINNHLQDGSYGIYLQGGIGNDEIGTFISNNEIINSYSTSVYLKYQDAPDVENNNIESTSSYVIYYGIYCLSVNNNYLINTNRVVNSISTGGRGIVLSGCIGTAVNFGLITNNMIISKGNACFQASNCDYSYFYHNSAHSLATSSSKYVINATGGTNNEIINNNLTSDAGATIYNLEKTSMSVVDYNNLYQTVGAGYGLIDVATCTESVSGGGTDDSPTILSIPLACNNGGAITNLVVTSMYIDGCGVNSDLDIYIDGVPTYTNQCSSFPVDITGNLPITSSLEFYSTDIDFSSDVVAPSVDVSLTYNPITPQPTFFDWQGGSGFDANSTNVDPLYLSNTSDLHLTGASPIQLQNGANINIIVQFDFDDETRSNPPYIGADEYFPPPKFYWVGTGDSWTNPSKWANSSGGATCNCTPTATDDIIFDSNSFTVMPQTIDFPSGTYTIKSIDFQDPNKTPIFTGSGVLIIQP